jgi:hypothetical protein
MGYTTQPQLRTTIDQPDITNPNRLKMHSFLQGLQTAHNHEHEYHDSLHSAEANTLYPWVVIPSPFGD